MDLIIGPEVLKSYKRLSYKVWYAFAEFIDNSTQAYTNNIPELEAAFNIAKEFLTVEILIENNSISIRDNSIGMDESDLQKALTLGIPPTNIKGRSKYGLGLKTSAFWFGDSWTIKTKKLNEDFEYSVTLNLEDIINRMHSKHREELKPLRERSDLKVLDVLKTACDKKLHYTHIKITQLNRKITENIKSKTKEYLRSIYRYDLQSDQLILFFNGERLSWARDEFKKRLLTDDTGVPYYRDFSFEINGKEVSGWAGVLRTGSRKDGGFSLLQSHRVIQGWPNGYKSVKLFGDQDGGINNLTNQRLIGELFLDDFNVSHTKDEILFEGDEEEKLDEQLFKKLIDLKRIAEAFRKGDKEEIIIDFKPILNELINKLQTPKFRALLKEFPVLKHQIIKESNHEVVDRAMHDEVRDKYFAEVSGIKICIIINNNASPYDPYLVIRIRAKQDELAVVINKNHPHWQELTDMRMVYGFVKDCVLDGLSEWKATKLADSIEPSTIKSIKDAYLREYFDLRI